MVDQLTIDVSVFIGSVLGAAAATLLPYWQKVRQNEAAGLPPLVFDKKFLGTLAIAFVIGIVAAVMSFDENVAKINPEWTAMKVFVVSAIAAATSNVTLNRLLSVSAIQSLLKENKKLKDIIKEGEPEKLNSDGKPSSV